LAAAKCRNRRRELTDRLQGETDHLEDHQQMLQREIIALKREKTNLEYILASHSPNCRAGIGTTDRPMKSFHQQYAELTARQEAAIDLSTVSSHQPHDNVFLAEYNDSTLPLKKREGMGFTDSISTPTNNLPVSIPYPFHFRHHLNAYEPTLERQRNRFRRQTAIDHSNFISPGSLLDHAQQATHAQNYQEGFSPKQSSFAPYHSPVEEMRMKPNLTYQSSGGASDSEYNSASVNPSFSSPITRNPLNLMGRRFSDISQTLTCVININRREYNQVDIQRTDRMTKLLIRQKSW